MLLHKYYHKQVGRTFRFLIPSHKKILLLGSLDGSLLKQLSPMVGVGIEPDSKLCGLSQKKFPSFSFYNHDFHKFNVEGEFDYIILNGALGKTSDICQLLNRLQKNCHASTRLLIYQHNHLWQLLLSLAERFKLKRQEGINNWLSVSDVATYLKAAGFEQTRIFRRNLFPLFLGGLGKLVNDIAIAIPFFDRLKLDQYILARPQNNLIIRYPKSPSLTICLTVRDVEKNIEMISKAFPQVCTDQEIIFVEGDSHDQTRLEIKRMIRKYPEKNIRLIIQPGKGQGDAIRTGFKKAMGDIIILYEGDGTSDPSDLKYVYQTMNKGYFEFIEGSRFVYPLNSQIMPIINQLGNIFFARWFSFFLNQRTTDVLSGIKAINRQDYQQVFDYWDTLPITDPFGDFNLLYGAARMGLQFGEVPIKYYPRVHGKSKTKPFYHGTYLLRMALHGYNIFRSY